MNVLAFGEIIGDILDGKETLGGAAPNFSASVHRLGAQAFLVSAVGDDAFGGRALSLLTGLGLETEGVQIVPNLPRGVAHVQHEHGQPKFAILRPAAFDALGEKSVPYQEHLHTFDCVYFGTLMQTVKKNERCVASAVDALPSATVFYDANLREGNWNLELVQRLSNRCNVLKLNLEEAMVLSELSGFPTPFALESFSSKWASLFSIRTLCITLGAKGCFVLSGHKAITVPGFNVSVSDTIGAGDAFSAALLFGVNAGWPLERICRTANAVGAIVAGRSGGAPDWSFDDCLELIRSNTC